jgi:hypothetical protein
MHFSFSALVEVQHVNASIYVRVPDLERQYYLCNLHATICTVEEGRRASPEHIAKVHEHTAHHR